jgi:hypothetical protein
MMVVTKNDQKSSTIVFSGGTGAQICISGVPLTEDFRLNKVATVMTPLE